MCQKLSYCNRKIDSCIQNEVEKINRTGFNSISSCCGHKKYEKTIVIRRKNNSVIEFFTGIILKPYNPKFDKRHNIYYKKDKQGFYFIPELVN